MPGSPWAGPVQLACGGTWVGPVDSNDIDVGDKLRHERPVEYSPWEIADSREGAGEGAGLAGGIWADDPAQIEGEGD